MCKTNGGTLNLAAALISALYASGGRYHERCVAPGDSPEVRPEDRGLFCVGTYEARERAHGGNVVTAQEVWIVQAGGDQVGAPLSSGHPHDTGASLSALLTAAAQGRLVLLDDDGAPTAPTRLCGPRPSEDGEGMRWPREWGPTVSVGRLVATFQERGVPSPVARFVAPLVAHSFGEGRLTPDEANGAVAGVVAALSLASNLVIKCAMMLTREDEASGATLTVKAPKKEAPALA